jgi:hypothetical protein
VSQLSLFEQPAPAPALWSGGAPPGVQRRAELAFSEPVKAELVARLNERPGEWLEWRDYADIRERHQIGFCLGHVMFRLSMEGRALRKEIYFGAERPSDPFKPYLGFKSVYSSVEHGPAPCTSCAKSGTF